MPVIVTDVPFGQWKLGKGPLRKGQLSSGQEWRTLGSQEAGPQRWPEAKERPEHRGRACVQLECEAKQAPG